MTDLFCLGRVGMDLFAEQIGLPFTKIESFAASVGGSPSNIAIGTKRLGLSSAALTAVGQDKVGDFILGYLDKEGVDTRFVFEKPQGRSGLAVVGVRPPDQFPLTFYRENAADTYLDINDLGQVPLEEARALLLSASALSRAPCRDACLLAAERAHTAAVITFLDLDLRPDQWHDPRAYGVNVRALLPRVDIIIGTEEECYAALIHNPNSAQSTKISDLSGAQREGLWQELRKRSSSSQTWVVKRGASGVSILNGSQTLEVPGFNVEVLNTVGAGDAFASGLIYGSLQGWDWTQRARFANACGALVVSRHGCSSAMPTLAEVTAFLASDAGSP